MFIDGEARGVVEDSRAEAVGGEEEACAAQAGARRVEREEDLRKRELRSR